MKIGLLSRACLLAVVLAGCAHARPQPLEAPQPSLVQMMERLARAQDAYRRIAEARNAVIVALGALQLEIEVAPALDVPNACPSEVRALGQRLRDNGGVAVGPRPDADVRERLLGRQVMLEHQSHGERLAHGLYLLDAELQRDGRGSLGCAR